MGVAGSGYEFIRNHDPGLPPKSPNSGGLLPMIPPKAGGLGGRKHTGIQQRPILLFHLIPLGKENFLDFCKKSHLKFNILNFQLVLPIKSAFSRRYLTPLLASRLKSGKCRSSKLNSRSKLMPSFSITRMDARLSAKAHAT